MSKIFCKVCGMSINEKNFQLNELAIPEKNALADFKYCPFCGASSKYFVEDSNEILDLNFSFLDEDTKDAVNKAAKLEVFNGDFYNIASKKSKNEELKKLFAGLASIEYMHSRIHKKILGYNKSIVLREINYDKLDTDEKLLKAAEERERHAVEFYTKNMKSIKEEKIKEIFNAFIEVEGDHIILSEKRYK